MLVTVITAVKNGESYLPTCFRSVEAQTYPYIQHVIVDGKSTDGTMALVREYAETTMARAASFPKSDGGRSVVWITEPDAGPADATGKGLGIATGDVFVVLPSDDSLYPWAVRTAIDYLETHPGVDAVIGDSTRGWSGTLPVVHVEPPFSWRRYARSGIGLTPQATFVRRRVIAHQGVFDPGFFYYADWEWYARVLEGRKVANVREVLAHVVKHAGAIQISGPREHEVSERRAIQAQWCQPAPPGPVRFAARCAQALRRRIYARWYRRRGVK